MLLKQGTRLPRGRGSKQQAAHCHVAECYCKNVIVMIA